MSSIITPIYYQVYRREGASWFVKHPNRIFYNPNNQPTDLQNIAQEFGTTDKAVAIELFRINGGKPGYYLANLRDKKYYYCGLEWEDVRKTLRAIGIGRDEPS